MPMARKARTQEDTKHALMKKKQKPQKKEDDDEEHKVESGQAQCHCPRLGRRSSLLSSGSSCQMRDLNVNGRKRIEQYQ